MALPKISEGIALIVAAAVFGVFVFMQIRRWAAIQAAAVPPPPAG